MSKKVGLASLIVGVLAVTTCFSIGFSDWIVTSSKVDVSGSITADSHTTNGEVYADEFINVKSVTPIGYQVGRGFVNLTSTEFGTTVNISVVAELEMQKIIDSGAINSIVGDSKMSMELTLTISNTPSLINYFEITDLPISSSYFLDITSVSKTNTSTYFKKKWNIGYVSTMDVVPFEVNFTLKYQASLSEFPDLETNKITLSLLPGEYVNV